LGDKTFHVIPRVRELETTLAERDFNMDVPKDLYNQGELYNLTVKRGTLTTEERFKINEHIMHSIIILEQLPLPDYLKRVPEYAGTHHETMIGIGYPRKLGADELSIPSRIMAIADIFEALTASDRPYKKAKTLSEEIKILIFFKKDQHIDAELFDLFLTSGVYKEYAEQFLLADQVDDVDTAQYLN
jgi:HD-GYP domain-containing protein (c-di-GMP phosphodiesterase class II)